MLVECAGGANTDAKVSLQLAGQRVKHGPQWDNWLHRTVALPLTAIAQNGGAAEHPAKLAERGV